jgi:hypothetical protein
MTLKHKSIKSLPETSALPSARSTRQSLKNTRQMWHSAKKARQTVHRQRLLCRVLFLGHSAKIFAKCRGALGKEKQSLRRQVTETASLPSVTDDTRQRSYLCRVSAQRHSVKNQSLPSATRDTRQRIRQGGSSCQVLCRVPREALGKACLFAECQRHYTRQITYTGAQVLVICRVLWS